MYNLYIHAYIPLPFDHVLLKTESDLSGAVYHTNPHTHCIQSDTTGYTSDHMNTRHQLRLLCMHSQGLLPHCSIVVQPKPLASVSNQIVFRSCPHVPVDALQLLFVLCNCLPARLSGFEGTSQNEKQEINWCDITCKEEVIKLVV